MIDKSQVSIIIPHLGTTDAQVFALRNCLSSFLETCKINIIVAYNGLGELKEGGSGTGFLKEIVENQDRISYLQLQKQGQGIAVNAAIATVTTPWVMVTNDDMIYAPRWFEKLTENITDDMLCISPQLVEPQQGAPTFLTYFCGGAKGDFNKEQWLNFAFSHYNSKIVKPIRTGFNLPFLIRKDLWDTVGGYDPNYDPWGSNGDSDLEYKIRLAGIQPYQNTNCIVYHFSQTSGTFEPQNHSFWQKNWEYFRNKWGFYRTDKRIWEADFIMPDKERIFRPDWEGKYANI